MPVLKSIRARIAGDMNATPLAYLNKAHDRYQRIQDALWHRTKRRIAEADPRIGNAHDAFLLVRNWGNDEARAVLRKHDEQSRRIHERSNAECDHARHRDHIAENYFAYVWCAQCNATRFGRKLTPHERDVRPGV
jgi:hypothetical protein